VSFLTWIVLGLLTGFIASKIMNKNGEGAFLGIVFGIVGAAVGGLAFGLFVGVSGFNLYSLIVAVIGVVATCLSKTSIPVPSEFRSLNRNKKGTVDQLPVEPGPTLHNPPGIRGFLAATP
jgi:uncharacterized membrane protein YeaQ/YmgE (transglycosylase-associated protein family)